MMMALREIGGYPWHCLLVHHHVALLFTIIVKTTYMTWLELDTITTLFFVHKNTRNMLRNTAFGIFKRMECPIAILQ